MVGLDGEAPARHLASPASRSGRRPVSLPSDLALDRRDARRRGAVRGLACGVRLAGVALGRLVDAHHARSLAPPVRTVTSLPTGTEYCASRPRCASPVRKIGGRRYRPAASPRRRCGRRSRPPARRRGRPRPACRSAPDRQKTKPTTKRSTARKAERRGVAPGEARGGHAGAELVERGAACARGARSQSASAAGSSRPRGGRPERGRRRWRTPVACSTRRATAAPRRRRGDERHERRPGAETGDEGDEDRRSGRVGDDPPEAEPGERGEQPGEDEKRRDDRPDRFPQEDEAGAETREHGVSVQPRCRQNRLCTSPRPAIRLPFAAASPRTHSVRGTRGRQGLAVNSEAKRGALRGGDSRAKRPAIEGRSLGTGAD